MCLVYNEYGIQVDPSLPNMAGLVNYRCFSDYSPASWIFFIWLSGNLPLPFQLYNDHLFLCSNQV
jgi:hypothetical protein